MGKIIWIVSLNTECNQDGSFCEAFPFLGFYLFLFKLNSKNCKVFLLIFFEVLILYSLNKQNLLKIHNLVFLLPIVFALGKSIHGLVKWPTSAFSQLFCTTTSHGGGADFLSRTIKEELWVFEIVFFDFREFSWRNQDNYWCATFAIFCYLFEGYAFCLNFLRSY